MASEGVGELRGGEATRNEQDLETFCMNRPGGAKGVDKRETDQRHVGFEKCMHGG